MQVEVLTSQSDVVSSEQTASVLPSSNLSIEPHPELRAARARATYSRKPVGVDLAEAEPGEASTSSLPTSPSEQVFTSPMRSYGRNARESADEDDAGDVTITTDISPGYLEEAVAGKYGRSRHLESSPPSAASSDNEDEGTAPSTKKFQLGLSKAIFDSDTGSESDTSPALSRPFVSRAKESPVSGSDPFTGSLTSLPDSMSQGITQVTSVDRDEEEHRDILPPMGRRGGKISAMRGKNGQPSRNAFSSDSEDEDQVSNIPKRDRAFRLASSSDAAVSQDQVPSKRERMEVLAAKARRQKQAETEDNNVDPLVDDFFGDAGRSSSTDIHGSDDDDHNDAMPSFRKGKRATAKGSKRVAKPKRASRDILSDVEDQSGALSQLEPQSKALPRIKPQSKKDLEMMHRETARLDREYRTKLAPVARKVTTLQDLLNKIGSGRPDTASSRTVLASSDLSSSEIPSAHSQHQSDPIESDPIKDRSSPRQTSSPLIALNRQQEHRLGSSMKDSGSRTANMRKADLQSSLVDVGDEDSDELPELGDMLESSRQQQKQQEAANAYLEKKRKLAEQMKRSKDVFALPTSPTEDDDLEIYKATDNVLSRKYQPTTPGRERAADVMYKELGIKSSPGHRVYKGTNAAGSPNGGHEQVGDDDEDDLTITDSQMHKAGRVFALASDKASGRIQEHEVHPAPSSDEPKQEHSRPRKSGPVQMTQAQLNATMMRKMQNQNLQARKQKEQKARTSGVSMQSQQLEEDLEVENNDDIEALLQGLQHQTAKDDDDVQNSDEENDSDFRLDAGSDAPSVMGSDVEMGSASEAEDLGDEAQVALDAASISDAQDMVDEAEDSEKENAPPPSSQQSQTRHTALTASPNLNRGLPNSRRVMEEDDDDDSHPSLFHVRRHRPAAVVDDEEEDDDDDIREDSPEKPRAGADQPARASQSQSQDRIPLGDISSQSIAAYSRSSTSSPALVHAAKPANAVRSDREVFPGSGNENIESFCTNDVPSDAGAGFSQFFAPTMPPPSARPFVSSPATQTKSFWDQGDSQSQSQTQTQQVRGNGLKRDDSANSALGAFFNDTQQESLRGESLDLFDNPKVAGGKALGFTQLYQDATPPPETSTAENGQTPALGGAWDSSSMPPPKSTDVDAFAALRRAQMGAAMEPLDSTPSVLPTLDESQAEREAFAAASSNKAPAMPASPEKMYLNSEGFFTQTKPADQYGRWTQYDSQQSQIPTSLRQSPSSLSRNTNNPFTGSRNMSPSPREAVSASNGLKSRDRDVEASDEEIIAVPHKLKRLRRGGQEATRDGSKSASDDEDQYSMDEDDAPPSSQNSNRPRNAFDLFHNPRDRDVVPPVKGRKSAFIEGEAEESEDEELHKGEGGLPGVFANEAGSDDESDEDDADAEDIRELVNNEKELDEAEKDLLAQARYQQDRDAQDKLDLEIAQRAAQGGFRNSRRGRGAGLGLDDILDDEADEEELRRRAMTAPGVRAWKKRKVDGDQDGMDALAEDESALPFVQGYKATHMIDHESDKYDFLVPEPEEDGVQHGSDDDDDAGVSDKDNASDEEEDDDVFGEPKARVIKNRFEQVRAELRDRRKAARKRDLVEDDEDDLAESAGKSKRPRNVDAWESEEEEESFPLAMVLKDRTKSQNNASTEPTRAKKAQTGTQYGRNPFKHQDKPSHGTVSNENESDATAVPLDDEDDEEKDTSSLFARLTKNRAASHTKLRLGQQVDLEDAEPEFGNDANSNRAPRPSTTSGSQSSRLGSASRQNSASMKSNSRSSSLLLGRQALMRRDQSFSTSSSS